jgi:hypothetical protein
MDKLKEIRDLSSSKPDEKIISSSSEESEDSSEDDEDKKVVGKLQEESDDLSSDDEKPLLPIKKTVPITKGESSSDDSSEDKNPKIAAVKNVVPKTDESSSDDESEDESDRPTEGTEVVDVESTLANVIAGNKKIGELAKVQRSVLKCMGLLS